MLRRVWLRFTLQALFLLAVAVVAGLLDLSIPAIVGVMFAAYLLTVVVEWGATRAAHGEPAAESPTEAGAVADLEPAVAVVEPGPVVVPEPVPPRDPEPYPQPTPEPEPPLIPEPEPPLDPEPSPDPVPEPQPDPVPTPAPEPTPVPTPEPAPAPQFAEAQPEPELEVEPDLEVEPEPEPEPVRQLVAVAAPPPEPEPEPEPARAAAPAATNVATLPVPSTPQAWNLWELERLARERAGEDSLRDEEWGYLLVYLREFAAADGRLPLDFDALVRESFGDLVAGSPR